MNSSISFVNREEEQALFLALLPPISLVNAILIIRSPSGYGKSRLFDKLIETIEANSSVQFIVIEPSLREKQNDYKVYNGFYIQQIASHLNTIAEVSKNISIEEYLKKIKWKMVKDKKLAVLLKQYPGIQTIYTTMVDYIQRMFSIGDFSSKSILEKNESYAIEICRQYIDEILNIDQQTIVVIRESQHIDEESLKFLLQNQRKLQKFSLVLEYTSASEKFFESHAKIFDRNLDDYENVYIHDLLKLSQAHLQQLLNQYIHESLTITPDCYLNWDGNLRTFKEIKYQVYINRKVEKIEWNQDDAFNLNKLLEKHLAALSREMKILLLVILENKEGVPFGILKQLIGSIDLKITSDKISKVLQELIYKHNYLIEYEGLIRFENEDISYAIRNNQSYIALRRFVQKKLREYYLEYTLDKTFKQSALSSETRRALELCIATDDTASIVKIVDNLSKEITKSHDQLTYIATIHEAIVSNKFLIDRDKNFLIDWAAALAYEVGDYYRATVLLNMLPQLSSYQALLMSCSLLESGEHDRAIEIINQHVDTTLYSAYKKLVLILYLRFLNRTDEARILLFEVIESNINTIVSGYAYRFTEMVLEFPECISYLEESIKIFSQKNLRKSEAYSRLACAVHMARAGNIQSAKTYIEKAQQLLENEISDKHILLNNKSIISLFDFNTNYLHIEQWLETALLYSKDDFSDATILNNLAISKFYLGNILGAEETIQKVLKILKSPDFKDKDIYWAIYYNAAKIFTKNGQELEANRLIELALQILPKPSSYPGYWEYRYQLTEDLNAKYSTMISYELHPLFLSHWLIDYEGILMLKKEYV